MTNTMSESTWATARNGKSARGRDALVLPAHPGFVPTEARVGVVTVSELKRNLETARYGVIRETNETEESDGFVQSVDQLIQTLAPGWIVKKTDELNGSIDDQGVGVVLELRRHSPSETRHILVHIEPGAALQFA